ncbi:MAG: hypothetical protein C5B50_19960 [Verrucomicrobia bacterium]|nr:MAG: hypothetical protein C5B50_19960 [Verrucomicrobiota bacterium]
MASTLPRTIFITATDTGVGKTLLTALLYLHLKSQGHRVLAIKPFCCGGRNDAELFHALQCISGPVRGRSVVKMKRAFSAGVGLDDRKPRALPWAGRKDAFGVADAAKLTIDQINPFYLPEPVAPLVAARKHRRTITFEDLLDYVQGIQYWLRDTRDARDARDPSNPPTLLIEGAGGLLAPLGPGYSALDIISCLQCQCTVISPNRLGTLNHTLLTIRALQAAGIQDVSVSLNDSTSPNRDQSCRSNPAILKELLAPRLVIQIPFLGDRPLKFEVLERSAKRLDKQLGKLLATARQS